MSSARSQKHVMSDDTKLRIICAMFNRFSLIENDISPLANKGSLQFMEMARNVTIHQPDLLDQGEALLSILESFVSNQNSRLFCALTELYLWYEGGMSCQIMQLTSKHLHSIFRRPPYETRPYTRELTYAQQLIMVFQLRDPQAWDMLTNAYDAMYWKEFEEEWFMKDKFMVDVEAALRTPRQIYTIIDEMVTERSPLTQEQLAQKTMTPSTVLNALPQSSFSTNPRILKSRTMSATAAYNARRTAAHLGLLGKSHSAVSALRTTMPMSRTSTASTINLDSQDSDLSSWFQQTAPEGSQDSQSTVDVNQMLTVKREPMSYAGSSQSISAMAPPSGVFPAMGRTSQSLTPGSVKPVGQGNHLPTSYGLFSASSAAAAAHVSMATTPSNRAVSGGLELISSLQGMSSFPKQEPQDDRLTFASYFANNN
ncbi:hypothetical protein GGF46_003865 [Coemansia sp. RSA 552]|nr:hypothetical protein GGF46_003865 [Coemansia sp. RSA 552]